MNATLIVNVLLESSSPEDFARAKGIRSGSIPRVPYKDGWNLVTPDIADQVGIDFKVCCEGSYSGPHKGYLYAENGKPLLLALVKGQNLDCVNDISGNRIPRARLVLVSELIAHLGLIDRFGYAQDNSDWKP